ncbi:MAG: PilW family protein [Gammaproteobacteria bacterium]|nr:PilW family protein [Gammaproteobacteria bacterium]
MTKQTVLLKKRSLHFSIRQIGFSLLELLIALGLSATLMAGVVGVFLGMFQTDRTQEGISRMQEAGRFATNFISQDVRMAGYLGCSSTLSRANINNTLNAPPASFQPDRTIQGWDADGTDPGNINNGINNEAVVDTGDGGWSTSGGNVIDDIDAMPGTDMFRIWGADASIEGIINSITPGVTPVFNVTDTGISEGDVLLLSDCEKADWVQACDTQSVGSPATLNISLSATCAPGNIASAPILVEAGARVLKLGGNVFYIGKRDNVNTNPPTLFRRQLDLAAAATLGVPEELVEGVEDMQVLYGENTNADSNNSADRYVPADQVTNWDNVVSLQITFLIQSLEDNLLPDPAQYTYNSVLYDGESGNGALPTDGRLRRVFTSTITLRNVTLGG